MEHRHIIESHHKEMQALRDEMRLAKERFESLSDKNVQDLKEFKTYAVSAIDVLDQRVIANKILISEQKRTIEDLHGQLLNFQDLTASKADIEKSKKAVELQLKDSTTSHLNSFQDSQRELKLLYKSLKEDLEKAVSTMEQRLVEATDKSEENFSMFRIDKEGVLKEVRIYKMDMFVIEKKIENIYTLIERINKRGTS